MYHVENPKIKLPPKRVESPSFFAKLFGAEKPPEPVEEAAPEDDEETYKKYNIQSLVKKAKPSFKTTEFEMVMPENNEFHIDGLPTDKKAFGEQFNGQFDKKKDEPYCDCDVCKKKGKPQKPEPVEEKPAPPPPVVEEKKEEKVEVKKEEEYEIQTIHNCCHCCSSNHCRNRNYNYRKPKTKSKPQKIRLIINVDK